MPLSLPLRHLSIRVPWHEREWNGTICPKPSDNSACLCLPGIRETRIDSWEIAHAGENIADLRDDWPPCVRERGAFMAARSVTIPLTHKLAHDETWKHLQTTPLELPAFSAPALPFRWVNREGAAALAEIYGTGFDPELEPRDGWKENSSWVLHPQNQKRCLDAFWSAIKPKSSLCFFYAKAIPGVEESGRVLVGVGRVDSLLPLRQYVKGDPEGFEAWVWERPVIHTIRPAFQDGFLLPYHALREKAATDPSIVFADFVAFAPDDHRDEFSYASELVTADAALRALESCRAAIERAEKVVPGPWGKVLSWINDRSTEVLRQRGPYPGLGAALTALGLNQGLVIAAELTRDLPPEADPWSRVTEAFNNPKVLPAELRSQITPSLQSKFRLYLRPDRAKRWEFLRLLSRFALSADQARLLWNEDQRKNAGIETRDEDFLANPYLIYEERRYPACVAVTHSSEQGEEAGEGDEQEIHVVDPVSFWKVDRGVFLPASFAANHPLPSKDIMTGADDSRRVRALAMHVLYRSESEGHSLLPLGMLAERGRAMTVEPPCPMEADLLEALQETLEDRLVFHQFADGTPACQLNERDEVCTHVRNLVRRARLRPRMPSSVNWPSVLDRELKAVRDAKDERARVEKAAALRELAESPLSVLIGPAGTGKTTLLGALCSEPSVKDGGVLLLAPTGKARVRLQTKVKLPAQTLAQFLRMSDRYQPETGRYLLAPGRKGETRFKTVIVDEASMLTEDQLAALAEAIATVDRIILVGDPGQLPPIGIGRPFVDLVKALEPATRAAGPRIARGYAELTERMRQTESGEDLELAELFSGRPLRAGDDQIVFDLNAKPDRDRLLCVTWSTPDELRTRLREVLAREFDSASGLESLCASLGGTCDAKGRWYFNLGAEKMIESWQVLAPVRLLPGGTEDLNRLLQQELRGSMLRYASGKQVSQFRVPKPLGPQQIVYGDKVINISNQRNRYVKPREGALAYLANGEIGVVIGDTLRGPPFQPWFPWRLHIAFGSQQGYRYSFTANAFSEEGDATIELAYAITVHKAQGSEFGKTIIVLPEQAPTLCRELLYTALTRHQEKLIILHQGDLSNLLHYTAAEACETARRFTNINLNDPDENRRPLPVEITNRQTGRKVFFEQSLIHRTRGGLLVRSKSEVIVAAELDFARERKKLRYEYEEPLPDKSGGPSRYPDFTIYDDVLARTFYWEHCGMLSDENYRRRWEAKERWYKAQGITRWDPTSNPDGRLIVTEDGLGGEIDAERVKEIVRALTS